MNLANNLFAVAVDCLGDECETGLPQIAASDANLQVVLQIVFGLVGAIAVVMIIVGSLRYVASQGNPQEAAKARGTLLYAILGLVIAVIAELLVTFVLSNI